MVSLLMLKILQRNFVDKNSLSKYTLYNVISLIHLTFLEDWVTGAFVRIRIVLCLTSWSIYGSSGENCLKL